MTKAEVRRQKAKVRVAQSAYLTSAFCLLTFDFTVTCEVRP